jgi:hypothetical protein
MSYRGYKALLILAGLFAACTTTAGAADTITGVVRNRTRGQFAAGDEVILLRVKSGVPDPAHLNQSMQEEARTRTDSLGSFTLAVRYPGGPHLVRVVHERINYDRQASVGDGISVDVFDTAARVHGITGTIEIVRIGSLGNSLHVSDMIEIKNDSYPPVTQMGERTFEVYLPAQAKIDSAIAAYSSTGSGKTAVLISAAPVPGEPGHYAVNFPLQPGTTKFAFNYDLPYDGHAAFQPRSIYPLQQLAVMIPPTMRFTSSSPAFLVLHTDNDRYQVEAANMVEAGAGPQFEISGIGALPALAQTQSSPKPPVAAPPIPALPAPAPARGKQWWTLSAGAVVLLACGFLLWRRHRLFTEGTNTVQRNPVQKTGHVGETRPPVEVFRAELRQLEIDWSLGAITRNEYAAAKRALEETVMRASRNATPEMRRHPSGKVHT